MVRRVSSVLLVFAWGETGGVFEVLAEEGPGGEVEVIGDLLDGVAAALEQGFGFEDDVFANPLSSEAAAGAMRLLREVFRRDAQLVGVEEKDNFCVFFVAKELTKNHYLCRVFSNLFQKRT